MKTITLKGKIVFRYMDDKNCIFLIGKDGYQINLVSRVDEIARSFPEKEIQVNYYLSDNYCSKQKMIAGFLGKVYGKNIDADTEDHGFMGSSMTGWCSNWVTRLKFGGHDLMRELKDKEEKFMIIDFNIH